jgi:iron(II)-dependent oxidoreductase
MARIPAFRMDRNEVTVGRWRHAIAEGFSPPADGVAVNDGPLPTDPASVVPDPQRTSQCTYTSVPMGRETYPLLCVTWNAAQAFCRFYGGDLPLEVEWAYAANAAARPAPTAYPWSGSDFDLPPCSRATFGRGLSIESDVCTSLGFGPQPVETSMGADGDISAGLGIANLGGSASEWMRDDTAPLNSICWMRNGLDLPQCTNPAAYKKEFRGGSWLASPEGVPTGRRYGWAHAEAALDIGFRCAREGP